MRLVPRVRSPALKTGGRLDGFRPLNNIRTPKADAGAKVIVPTRGVAIGIERTVIVGAEGLQGQGYAGALWAGSVGRGSGLQHRQLTVSHPWRAR